MASAIAFLATISSLLLLSTTVFSGNISLSEEFFARNCHELLQMGVTEQSGVYTVHPYDQYPIRPVQVYCDMQTEGGGWTLIQRRVDIQPREDFYRSWTEYVLGFGDLHGEFWLGLDHIHALTDQALNEIRFDLEDFEGECRFAKYRFFYVRNNAWSYMVEVDGYTGNAGDSFSYHNKCYFQTKDSSSSYCAQKCSGAWWYGDSTCEQSNLNGLYLSDEHEFDCQGIEWEGWHGLGSSLKRTEMRIRPAYF